MAKKGLVFITKSTFSGASSVNIDNCFSATYTHYLVKRNLLGSSAALNLYTRLRVGGADASAGNYRYQYVYGSSTTVAGNRATAQTEFQNAPGKTEATSFGYAEMWISNPFEAVRTTLWCDYGTEHTGNIEVTSYVQAHDLATSYTGITVFPGSGTITGSISVFGLVKS